MTPVRGQGDCNRECGGKVRDAAAPILLMWHGYLRPSEALNAQADAVVPLGAAFVVINLHAEETGNRTARKKSLMLDPRCSPT